MTFSLASLYNGFFKRLYCLRTPFVLVLTGKEGVDTNRGGYIMARLPELARCNLQHQQAVFQVQMDHPELEIPQLYRETYLNN